MRVPRIRSAAQSVWIQQLTIFVAPRRRARTYRAWDTNVPEAGRFFIAAVAGRGESYLANQLFDFSRVFPIVGIRNEPGPHRILENVIPFFCVTFVGPKHMIKKLALP